MFFLSKKVGGEPPLFFSLISKKILKKNVNENTYFFYSGRNAILEIIKKEKASEIFIPKYYCYPVYFAIKNLENINIINYSSKEDLIIKMNKIDKFKKKLIIYLIFNGLQKTLNEYYSLNYLESHTIVNVVDAAMTSSILVKNFNYDYLITNPRKFYRIPIGGIVFTKKNLYLDSFLTKNPFINLKYLTSKLFSRFLLDSKLSILEKFGLIINKYSEDNVPEKTDIYTHYFLKKLKIFDLSYSRVEQYNAYFNLLKPINKLFLFDFLASNEDCPFGFILKVDDVQGIFNYLSKKRIYISELWKLPDSLKNEINENELFDCKKIIVLPIGPQYNLKDIEKVSIYILKFFNK